MLGIPGDASRSTNLHNYTIPCRAVKNRIIAGRVGAPKTCADVGLMRARRKPDDSSKMLGFRGAYRYVQVYTAKCSYIQLDTAIWRNMKGRMTEYEGIRRQVGVRARVSAYPNFQVAQARFSGTITRRGRNVLAAIWWPGPPEGWPRIMVWQRAETSGGARHYPRGEAILQIF